MLKLDSENIFHVKSTSNNGWIDTKLDSIQLWLNNDFESYAKNYIGQKVIVTGNLHGDAGTIYYLSDVVIEPSRIEFCLD